MTALKDMPLDTNAYLADTTHLGTIEHGAYLLILMALWRSTDASIPGDDSYLARATRMTLGRWKRIAPTIRKLLIAEGDCVTQKRVLKDRKLRKSDSNFDKNVSPGGNPIREPKSLKTKDPTPKIQKSPSSRSTSLTTSFVPTTDSENQVSKKDSRGSALSAGWTASSRLVDYGLGLGLGRHDVERCAEDMRLWALGNSNRPIARKANWDATFMGWLRRQAQKSKMEERRASAPRQSRNGFAAMALDLMEADE